MRLSKQGFLCTQRTLRPLWFCSVHSYGAWNIFSRLAGGRLPRKCVWNQQRNGYRSDDVSIHCHRADRSWHDPGVLCCRGQVLFIFFPLSLQLFKRLLWQCCRRFLAPLGTRMGREGRTGMKKTGFVRYKRCRGLVPRLLLQDVPEKDSSRALPSVSVLGQEGTLPQLCHCVV